MRFSFRYLLFLTTSLFLIAAANAQLANVLPGSENSPNERRRVAPISKVKFALPSATYGVDHHVVRVMKDSKA